MRSLWFISGSRDPEFRVFIAWYRLLKIYLASCGLDIGKMPVQFPVDLLQYVKTDGNENQK